MLGIVELGPRGVSIGMDGRRNRPKRVFARRLSLGIAVFALAPTHAGFQDLASLFARQPSVTAHWREHMRAVAFGTVRAATFSFFRPIGTSFPEPLSYRLANIDPKQETGETWPAEPGARPDALLPPFPTVDRSGKGDRLPLPPKPETARSPEPPPRDSAERAPSPDAGNEQPFAEENNSESQQAAPGLAEASPRPEPAPAEPAKAEASAALLPAPQLTAPAFDPQAGLAATPKDFAAEPQKPAQNVARLYFGGALLGDEQRTLEPWAPGEQPTIVAPPPSDSDIKLSALSPAQPADETKAGESVAPKGEVTGEGRRPKTPAERLGLSGATRAKAEKCLADAVYFEARGEPVRGQMAVAQVVMNRVFSGYYPRNVCQTVYQNANRRFACQFTFACDGIPETVDEPQAWLRAERIADDYLDGKYWVAEVGRATHYHAYWVHPDWVHEMHKLYRIGVHTFYRPRAWGDGSDAPSWGTAEVTQEAAAKL